MSKRINVNPDHYKVAGRERQGHGVAPASREPAAGSERARGDTWRARQQKRAKTLTRKQR